MTKEDFFKKNDEKFLALGFEKDTEDPMFYYSRSLVSDEQIEESDIDECYIPKTAIWECWYKPWILHLYRLSFCLVKFSNPRRGD